MLDDYVGKTIRIRATFVKTQFGDTRLGATERMLLRNLSNDETGDFIENQRTIPYDRYAKSCSAEPGDTIIFTADIKAGKNGSKPAITRARDFSRD